MQTPSCLLFNLFNPASQRWLDLAGRLRLPGMAPAATKTWTGGGVLEKWKSDVNWAGGAPSPGDDLFFPANGATGFSTDNNFSGGTSFRSIRITSRNSVNDNVQGWTHKGNALSLEKSMTFFSYNSLQGPITNIRLPVTLADDATFYFGEF